MTPAQNRILEVHLPITASMKWRATCPSIFYTLCTDLGALTMQLPACLPGKGLCWWPDKRNVKHHEKYFDSIIHTSFAVLSHLSSVKQRLIHMYRHLIVHS
ncbi:Major surface-labeled trophozoite antigen precursor/ 28.3 kd protein c21orf2 [Giardia duodenalis assemblage B]|uniref:Major surface-labeled trophozoite antigen/ 28.3 kd protein c21orf2 n=1 Tax=Giardia duodenalis assemblage B TaxID=1394984 RepID=A0A132NML6_GIAIN|nr:Major surface-labeled trophozoite antigen precursor/ 28.3 kd protein c21orf2 [Giardia intestinalis assemblage B]